MAHKLLTGTLLGAAMLLSACGQAHRIGVYAPHPEETRAASASYAPAYDADVTDAEFASWDAERRYREVYRLCPSAPELTDAAVVRAKRAMGEFRGSYVEFRVRLARECPGGLAHQASYRQPGAQHHRVVRRGPAKCPEGYTLRSRAGCVENKIHALALTPEQEAILNGPTCKKEKKQEFIRGRLVYFERCAPELTTR